MSPQLILYLILSISIVSYIFNIVLEYLNLRAQRRDIPDEIASFYDHEKYLKSLDYHQAQTRFSFISGSLSFLVSIAMLAFGGFGWVDARLSFIQNEIFRALAFFGLIMVASDILSLPSQLYSVFVIEERFGFNKTTLRTFFIDKIKGYLIGAVFGGTLLSLMILLVNKFGPDFWILFGTLTAVVILLINMFYTSLLLPIFNKLTILPDGELKSAIESFAMTVNFPLDNIFVMDGSKRSRKANAFFSGIGRRKKIVLYDTLIENHTIPELVAVLAHEVGHFKKKHIIWSYVVSIVQIFFVLFVLSRMIFSPNLSEALGGSQATIYLNLIAFAILFSPISAVTGVLVSMLSRRNEFEADKFAKDTFEGQALADALKKLSVDSLSNLYPHPAYVFFHYSHPPLLKRLEALRDTAR